ncbi:hypothetical protein BGX38DRAFT_1327251 [Terfezia claveryi]|nr:hypothetical protein BGX38DRAFT_1327251 [Terfezia claveryi]
MSTSPAGSAGMPALPAAALLAKSLWAPHPALPKELMSAVSKFVHELPDSLRGAYGSGTISLVAQPLRRGTILMAKSDPRSPSVHVAPALVVLSAFPPLHNQYSNNGRDLLLMALQDLKLLQTEFANTEQAERMARQVHIFAKELREEFAPICEEATSQPIPREFAPAGPASTLPQRKAKGKAKRRALTGMKMAERNSRTKRLRSNHAREPAAREPTPTPAAETQESILVQPIHGRPIHVISSTAPARV